MWTFKDRRRREDAYVKRVYNQAGLDTEVHACSCFKSKQYFPFVYNALLQLSIYKGYLIPWP